MNPEPLFSGDCAVLALLAFILGVLLLGAICLLCVHIKHAVLGKRLLDACDGDYIAARMVIGNTELETQIITENLLRRFG